jgi:hypothetical protein
MNSRPSPAAQGVLHNFRQIEGAGERRLRPAANDETGDTARLTLFAIDFEDTRKLARLGLVDQIRGGRAIGAHAHVERSVAHQREAAIGLVHLHRRHS